MSKKRILAAIIIIPIIAAIIITVKTLHAFAGGSASINNEANGIYYQYLKIHKKIKKNLKSGKVVIPQNDFNPSNTVIPGMKYVYKHGGLNSPIQRKREKVYLSSLESKTAKYVGELMPQVNEQGQVLTNEWIYIFMSSSVPAEVWHNYEYAINKMKQNHIIMVMRGCIGGCTGNNMVKTAMFIKRMLRFHGVYLTAPTVIDPYLFRFYQVNRVPEFVYAKKVNPYNPSITMGYMKNLKNKPVWYKVKGDFSFNYNLKRLTKESRSEKLKVIRRILNESFFNN